MRKKENVKHTQAKPFSPKKAQNEQKKPLCLCYLRFLLFKRFEKKIIRLRENVRSLAGLPNLCGPLCPLCSFLPLYPNGQNQQNVFLKISVY